MSSQVPRAQSEENTKKAQAVIRKWDKLKAARGIWETHWQEIADYILPRRIGFNRNTVPGDKRHQLIYDGTAPWALGELAAELHGRLTSQFNKWFLLETDPDLMQDRSVRLFLEDTEDRMFDAFNSAEANFNSQAHELYTDLCSFGTGIMDMEETPGVGPGFKFWTRYLGECCIVENDRGLVDRLYRKFPFSARNAVSQWGIEAVGPNVAKVAEEDPDKELTFIHEVKPRVDRDLERVDTTNKAFSSVYVAVDDGWLVSESGFDEFPFLVPRWVKAAGETYGRSPAMTCLPDVKMLNEMWKTIIKASQKIVDPPLMVPDDGFFLPIRTTPAGINFYRSGLGRDDRITPLETRANIPVGVDMADRRVEHILRCFFQDRLKLQKEKIEMTRFEAQERAQENLRSLSPIIGRLETEFMNELIERGVRILDKQGLLMPVPDILLERGARIRIKYVSPMARAQRVTEAGALEAAMSLIGPMVQANPEMGDNFDTDEIARSTKEWFGFPERLMRSKQKVRAVRQTRAQAQAQEQARIDAESATKVAAEQVAG